MLKKSQFGIPQEDGLLKTFFNNDWQHGILVQQKQDEVQIIYRNKARMMIISQLSLAVMALLSAQNSKVSSGRNFNTDLQI